MAVKGRIHALAVGAAAAWIGCAAIGCNADPRAAPPEAPAVSSTSDAPASTEAAPAKSKELSPITPYGRWRSDELCLELFENGDFEISLTRGRGPKQLVMGRARSRAAEDGAIALDLSVTRIWKARFLGKCREQHQTGHFAESTRVLDLEVVPEKDFSLTVRPKARDELELCGTRCVTLVRDEPLLGARWRKNTPPRADYPGELLEIAIDETSSHLWVGTAAEKHSTIYGATAVRSLGADSFEVSFTVDPAAGDEPGVLVPLFGSALEAGKTRVLTARRLEKQRLEVCEGREQCVTLERQFDAFRYDLL